MKKIKQKEKNRQIKNKQVTAKIVILLHNMYTDCIN